MLPVGLDLGNGAVKLVMRGLELSIPNVTAVGSPRSDLGERQEPLNALDVEVVSSAFTDGARRVFVGKLAADQGPQATYMQPNEKKTSSEQAILMYLTALASAVVKQRERAGERISSATTIDEELFVVSGVSLVEALERGVRLDFEQRLSGEHTVRFMSPSPWGGITVRLRITSKVVSEGHMAFLALCQQSPEKSKELSSSLVAVAEIGELSTELPVFERGNINASLSDGLQYGIGTTLTSLLEDIREQTKARNAFPGGRMELAKFLEDKKREVVLFGRRHDITEIIERHLSAAASHVYREIIEVWNKIPTIEHFYVLGGGAALLHPFLKEFAQQDGFNLEYAPTLYRSRWLNADGMFLTAVRLAADTVTAV
ncbi:MULTISPECIES: ParM/StbA family protein [Alicyclobacillus]|uniref:ParM/StbA family protein n=1 Tax=Alicyclobacillus acidoterrestris (strain ATCC 49025 / DSM 3922 / CIP 106132 / NCIMB 13137 / GD3B) TaxID=1356854 RepID=T0BSL1_ALIAG|nr:MULTISPECIES: ParM/StbA family protein [Alicyclobacillus]EPZ43789.1 hypothetical protein N007_12105 [Alicyclobacillus acidoterrestris ATCC 49025]UNO50984.1 ParM/StbA family protein [Alicyclobacillus acidoterrestris]GEO27557.1 hypothetical protein AAC03nite_33420 [Alicyclobacillus acidoterrestris]